MSPRRMLSLVYHGPRDLRIERLPIPEIGPEDALLVVKSAGICGTDLRIMAAGHRKIQPGMRRVLGHEVVGEIVGIGANVRGYEIGSQVFVAPNIGCGVCRQCISGRTNLCPDYTAFGINIDGAFAEYMLVPDRAIKQGNLIHIGNDLDADVGTLIEPLACVIRGQEAIGSVLGETVLIVGAGPIGIMHMMLAHIRGASRVIISELIPERITQAKELGAEHVINPREVDLVDTVLELTEGQGAEVVIVAAPAPEAQQTALRLASIRGRINFFGGLPSDQPEITFNSNLVHYKELIVTGTTACSTSDCQRAAEIVRTGRKNLNHLISARFPLSRALEAFEAASNRKSLKVIVQPGA